MKNKTLIILILVFLALLIGAYALYNSLSADMEIDTLVTQGETVIAETPAGETMSEPTEGTEPSPTEKPAIPAEEELPVAPDFTVFDIDGNEVRLSDFLGKPVVINFWATWCGYCKMHMPVFEEAFKTYGEEIHFVIVNLTDGSRETVESASAFIKEAGYSFPVYYDTSSSAAMAYGTSSIPVTYFIDAEGHAIAYGMGALDEETLQTGIDMIYTP